MVTLINPHTGKSVEASEGSVDVLLAAGFRHEKASAPVPVEKVKSRRPKRAE